jgi:hypothetical protein
LIILLSKPPDATEHRRSRSSRRDYPRQPLPRHSSSIRITRLSGCRTRRR